MTFAPRQDCRGAAAYRRVLVWRRIWFYLEGPFPPTACWPWRGRRLPGDTSTGGSGAGGRTPAGRSRPSSGGCWEPWWGPSSSTCCPSCPSWRLTCPCWGRTPPGSPPGTSPGGSCFTGGYWGPWGRWGSSAGGGSWPSARWGPTWCPPSPSSTPLAGWGAFWPGAATASPPRRGGGG